jgi:hypothetical protein
MTYLEQAIKKGYATISSEISQKAIEDIKNRRKPRSEAVGLKMLYELFPQMAV